MHTYPLLTMKLHLWQMISGCFLTPPETAHLHTSQHCTKQHILMWYFPGDVLMFCWLTSYNLMQESSVLCYWHIPGRLLSYYHNGLHIQFNSLGQPPHQPSPRASPALGQERVKPNLLLAMWRRGQVASNAVNTFSLSRLAQSPAALACSSG